ATVARHLGDALFFLVQLFEHGHRDEDVMLLEMEQRGGIVQQHIGVERIDALACGHARGSWGKGRDWGLCTARACAARAGSLRGLDMAGGVDRTAVWQMACGIISRRWRRAPPG